MSSTETLLILSFLSANLIAENQRLAELAGQDYLTGIGNHRALANYVTRQATSDKRSFVVVDADNLKQVNDQYGHAAGDEFLKAVAAMIRSESDAVFRRSGDEFVIVLGGGINAAIAVAERLSKTLVNVQGLGEVGQVSAGAGVTETEADMAMYAVKQGKKCEAH
ncbi:MAG: GGDEF domain-containing protein [Cyanobacteria bacterium P01_C01_bin.120]